MKNEIKGSDANSFGPPASEPATENSSRPPSNRMRARLLKSDLWPQLFSDVSCIALWVSSEKILTRLYSVLHWFHERLEANVKNFRENRCFQTVIVFTFGSIENPNKCTVLWKIAAKLIAVSTSVNNEMWVKLRATGRGLHPLRYWPAQVRRGAVRPD